METIEDFVLRPNNFKCFAKPGRSVTSFPEKIRRRRSERSMMNSTTDTMAGKKAPAKPMSRQGRKNTTTTTMKLSSNSSNNDTTVGASSFRGILNPPYRNYPSHPLHPMLLVVPPEHLGPQYAPCKCCQVIVLSILRLPVLCHGELSLLISTFAHSLDLYFSFHC